MIDALKSVAVDTVKDPQLSSVQSKKQVELIKNDELKAKNVHEKDLESALKDINEAFKGMNIARQFVIDKDVGVVVVKILDTEKQEVIRQIPSEDALRISKNIKEMIGLLFDKKS
ncbi:MAG: flagellar protein FlaG [Calditerrivibrio sp.]|nr:flagellar protein FlaG [Calditerrivibrio sp.]